MFDFWVLVLVFILRATLAFRLSFVKFLHEVRAADVPLPAGHASVTPGMSH